MRVKKKKKSEVLGTFSGFFGGHPELLLTIFYSQGKGGREGGGEEEGGGMK